MRADLPTAKMNSSTKKFVTAFAATALVAAFANLLPYLLTRGAYNGDGYEIIGFPFTFRRLGGYLGIYEFSVGLLLADIIVALLFAFLVAYPFLLVRKPNHI
jgi:hypothetical protein